MKAFSVIAVTSLISAVFSQQLANNATAPFNKDEDNYPFKTEITNATLNGYTIEYRNYYKIVTNTILGKTYCLVSGNQGVPEGCSTESVIQVPVQSFSIDKDSYGVVPFIELLGLHNNVTKTSTVNMTSPCIKDGSVDTSTNSPQLIFSSTSSFGASYVAFSGNDDRLAPLQKASWLMYIGAFFDMELKSYSIYTQISDNYNCHKRNLGSPSTPKAVSWTTFEPSAHLFTVQSDVYYAQLSQDAGGRLVSTNVAQGDTFKTNYTNDLVPLANALRGADFIIDSSALDVDYKTWVGADSVYFTGGNNIQKVDAIVNNKVYSINGLVSNNQSDWFQRAAARPDLALLDLIKLFYPDFAITASSDIIQFPVWLTPFTNETTTGRVITSEVYGGCGDMASTAFAQSACTIGGTSLSGGQYTKKLSTGETAGISVGTIMFVIVAACLGIWLYRRYRRQKRHNFYRMNDFQ
ncbi:conserved hypothetical protein [Mucor ambiguus]|uniref:Periplasmic binding protein n=1 Tax=Mucor ambiguus TaxID=91626 RepID=A0A0C9N8S3_9FUNG|nr:conserved hypothetical protein [Mucor ambiguus]